MSAIEDARASLAEYDNEVVYDGDRMASALRALIEPPTDDEREALFKALDGIVDAGIDHRDAVDAVIAAGFRRQGPITDVQVVAAMRAYWGTSGSRASAVAMRAALEAARAV